MGWAKTGFYLLEGAARRHIRVTNFTSTFNTKLNTILQVLTYFQQRSCIIIIDFINAAQKIKDHRAKLSGHLNTVQNRNQS